MRLLSMHTYELSLIDSDHGVVPLQSDSQHIGEPARRSGGQRFSGVGGDLLVGGKPGVLLVFESNTLCVSKTNACLSFGGGVSAKPTNQLRGFPTEHAAENEFDPTGFTHCFYEFAIACNILFCFSVNGCPCAVPSSSISFAFLGDILLPQSNWCSGQSAR
jgi:hypothetical protein